MRSIITALTIGIAGLALFTYVSTISAWADGNKKSGTYKVCKAACKKNCTKRCGNDKKCYKACKKPCKKQCLNQAQPTSTLTNRPIIIPQTQPGSFNQMEGYFGGR